MIVKKICVQTILAVFLLSCAASDADNKAVPGQRTEPKDGYLILDNQTFHEDMAIVGTPYALHYSSLRTLGNQWANTVRTWLYDPANVTALNSKTIHSARGTVNVAGRVYTYSSLTPFLVSNPWEVVWDGRDAAGNVVLGTVSAVVSTEVVSVSYEVPEGEDEGEASSPSAEAGHSPRTVNFNTLEPVKLPGRGDGPALATQKSRSRGSSDAEAVGDGGSAAGDDGFLSDELTIHTTHKKTETIYVGHLPAESANLGGWTLNIHHFYSTNSGVLHMGGGTEITVAPVGVPDCVVGSVGGVTGDFAVVSSDGAEIYIFRKDGRHERTVDSYTGAVRYRFGYDADNRLISISDSDNLTTVVERAAAGSPVALVGPYGHRTEMVIGPNGWLSALINPALETNRFTYTADGLLTNVVTRRGYSHVVKYDAKGNALYVVDPIGDYNEGTLTRDYRGYTIRHERTFGRVTMRRDEELSDGSHRRTITSPAGAVYRRTVSGDGLFAESVYPSGVVVTDHSVPDERWGGDVTKISSREIVFPSGLASSIKVTRAYSLLTPNDSLSTLLSYTQRVIQGSATQTWAFDVAARSYRRVSPEGRVRSVFFDTSWRPVVWSNAGSLAVTATYDTMGRIVRAQQGNRFSDFRYAADGTLSLISNAVGQVYKITGDAIGRVTNITLPALGDISIRHQPSTAPVGVKPPGRPEHQFGYDPVGQLQRYSAPGVGSVSTNMLLTWSAARELTSIRYPEGRTITNRYSSSGLLTNIAWAEDSMVVTYGCACGLVEGLSLTSGVNTIIRRDGSLVTNVAWSGAVSGNVSYIFDSRLQLGGVRVNGSNEVSYVRNLDGLVTNAGPLNITRRAHDGRISATALGSLTSLRTYNDFGETASHSMQWSGANLLAFDYGYDAAGRITSRIERIQAITNRYEYNYDINGRLVRVTTNGSIRATYSYDVNGNRTNATVDGTTAVGTYDAQDRMLTYGGATYQYDARGTLTNKVESGQNTAYVYDTRGFLRSVRLPDGTVIDYTVDAVGRRVVKKVNGTVQRKWIYLNSLKPIAELDASNRVVSTFVYATHPYVPDYMVRSGVTYRILSDHLGSVRMVVNTTDGTIAQQMDYDEWGNVTTDTNPGFQPFGFAAGHYDSHTQLTRFGYRDYDAATGRWLAKDPILFGGGQANIYLYCHGDPVNYIDPWGLGEEGVNWWSSIASGVAGGLESAADWVRTFPSRNPLTGLPISGTGFSTPFRNAISGLAHANSALAIFSTGAEVSQIFSGDGSWANNTLQAATVVGVNIATAASSAALVAASAPTVVGIGVAVVGSVGIGSVGEGAKRGINNLIDQFVP
ncbi:MAG: RHS repeat-associated core domain-containing protein [Kiritimatiellae bacterium]|nr:RHS repeat-associated core domain-containing protein [Kiritimatiellia bacterium]MCO5067745.1 hypothetical protein [Kiritimatiellia bacterium]